MTDTCTYSNEYSYNANGALDHDLNRDIDMILYDDLGNTRQIFYFDHEQIEYIYSADGTKLRAIYRPAASSALTDSTDYVGSLILKNGQPSMYMFDGGFVTFNSNGAIGSSRMHYYIRDYMGNNRMVVNRSGTTEQITHYYPYGGVIGDISTNESLQKYKFEGPRSHQKEIDNLLARRRAFRRGVELDRTFGLDIYDIHARQYFAMMPSWDRIDPLAEKSPGIRPYAYCEGDPINFGDFNGKDKTDVAFGWIIGLVSNMIPGLGHLRDSYTPSDFQDYNNGLSNVDAVSFTVGTIFVADGIKNVGEGVSITSTGAMATISTAAIGSSVTIPITEIGIIITLEGTIETAAGSIVLMNTSSNKEKGYNRGTKNCNSTNAKTHGKNESHGDGGRAKKKAEKQIESLKQQLQNTTKRKER